jgi:hypothetical protein
MFKLNQDASANGTSLQGYVDIAPATLVKVFGEPNESDGYKVSGEYVFTDDKGNVFTLYDWKSTTLYDPEYMRPSDLWAMTEPWEIHIGGAGGDWEAFREWLLKEVAKKR